MAERGAGRGAASVSWEVTLLRRTGARGRPQVAGRLRFEAPDARCAREAADDALAARSGREDGRWSLGVLRPLTPDAPGTYRYAVTFAVWAPEGEEFARHDTHRLTVWATDAQSARRLAHEEIQSLPAYRPAWRVRRVVRVPEAGVS